MSKMLRKRGGALELRMEKIKGGKLMIDHEANTFKVISKDENEGRRLEMSGRKLHNCPFCDGEASYTDNFYGNGTGHCVFCEDCGAGTAILTGASPPEELKAMVYRDWNRRAEVRHGRWIAQEDADGDISFVCSECGRRLRWDEDFCPSCGSDMRTADTKD